MTLKSSVSALLAAAISAMAAIAAPASAQDKLAYADQPYSDEIIVVAPHVQREYTGRRTAIGAPVVDLTMERVVTTEGLDLRYDGDARELRRRIEATAVDACNEIDRSSAGVPLTSRRDCVRSATNDAMAQADELIYAARG